MAKVTYFISVFIVLLFSACGASFGERYERGNLEIYYTEEMEAYVEPLADYFEDNDLIFEHKHSVLLTSSSLGDEGGSFILKMVADPEKEPPAQTMEQQVKGLELSLKKRVFSGANFKIQICDENFSPIKK